MFVHKVRRHHKKKNTPLFDELMFIPAVIAPFIILPQLKSVWIDSQTEGVSLFTWAAFGVISAFWAVYGFMHKDVAICLTNILLCIANFLVVFGVLFMG